MTQVSDEWLMLAVAEGRHEALETLVRRYANPLLTFIRRMLGDHHRSEELFQEVFVSVWRNRTHFQDSWPFKSWLYAIAVNACRSEFRRRRTNLFTLTEDDYTLPAMEGGSPDDRLIAAEHSTLVMQAVAHLPLKQRAVVTLRMWSDLSYAEIADILNRREGTIRAQMHQALRTLREHLEPRLREEPVRGRS